LIAFVVTACVAPDQQAYQHPQLPAKDDWTLTTGAPLSPAATIRPDWWAAFGDPRLDELIRKAIAGSPDIAILAARIDAAGIGLASEEISNLPTLGLGTGTDLGRTPDGTTRSYGTNLTGLNWEIDLWGKTRRSVQAQQAEFKASEADYRAGYLSLVAEVATNYFQLRQLDEQIETQEAGLDQNRRILSILQSQQREGLVAATRVMQQRAELRNLEKELLDLRRQRTLAENRLATLLGVPAGNLRVPPAPLSRSVHQVEVPAGLPADLLNRRPDILAAEYRVLRAHELVGKARLAKLPTIRLTGSGGLASAALSGLLGNWTLGLGLAVNMPIFDPNLDLEIERTGVEQQIAEQDYRRVVILAFEEVENSLVNLASRREQVEALERQLADLRSVNATVYARLRAGLVSQLEVFESERSLLSAEQSLLALQHQLLQDTVTLYKALGGGWAAEQVALAER
jgi:NodT family efflux transporter outer membrane factor (OMF) lipoprotein